MNQQFDIAIMQGSSTSAAAKRLFPRAVVAKTARQLKTIGWHEWVLVLQHDFAIHQSDVPTLIDICRQHIDAGSLEPLEIEINGQPGAWLKIKNGKRRTSGHASLATTIPSGTHDVVFVSNNEDNAEENWTMLLHNYPDAKRIDNVPGIFKAYQAAADICTTEFCILIDADNTCVSPGIDQYSIPPHSLDRVFIGVASNRVNGVISGHGGVKIFPRTALLTSEGAAGVDITTTLGLKPTSTYKHWSVHAFDTTPYNTWRTAFRETAKLARKIQMPHARSLLELWCSPGPNLTADAEIAKHGALAGVAHSLDYDGAPQVNDEQFIRELFSETLYG